MRTILVAVTGNERPDWTATVGGAGKVYQAEGEIQAAAAAAVIEFEAPAWGRFSRAVVTTLGIDPAPFVALGVTSCMVECYAQAGDEPYGDLHRMTWQAHHDGWPHVIPVVGVYDSIGLAYYVARGGAGDFKGGHWRGGPLGIYLAEGMTDTGSWPTLAAL